MAQKLINLEPTRYEHPFDKAALAKLRKLPGFDVVANFFLNWTYIKWHLVELKGSNFRITEESCPELYNHIKETADTLNLLQLPDCYTRWGYFINGYTTGYKKDTLLVLYSGAIDLMTKDELTFIIGHEMGHIKSGHVLYHMMANLFTSIIANIPVAAPMIQPIQVALMYWNRMSEFTSDRAGLLACQNVDATIDAIMKMAGLPSTYFNNHNRNAFLEQAKEFQEKYSGMNIESAIKVISTLDNTHPWTIMRAAELISWVESGEYEDVLNDTKGKRCTNPYCAKEISNDLTVCPYCGTILN